MSKLVVSAFLVALSTGALAQTAAGPAEIKQPGPPRITQPGTPSNSFVKPGGVDNGGPGSVGTQVNSGLGADSISNNSGAAGNANKPEVAVPNTGGGGGR